jgi:hypothetical protein
MSLPVSIPIQSYTIELCIHLSGGHWLLRNRFPSHQDTIGRRLILQLLRTIFALQPVEGWSVGHLDENHCLN